MKGQKITKKNLVFSAATLAVLFVLIGFSIFILLNRSLGWFSDNRRTGAGGAQISADAPDAALWLHYDDMTEKVSLLSGAAIPFELDIPGAFVDFVIEVENLSDSKALTVSDLLFTAPSASEEIPIVENAVSYWFSTQLYVLTADVTGAGGAAPSASAVTTALDAENSDGTVLGTAVARNDFSLLSSSVTIPAGESVFLAVRVTFKNLNEDQSVYRNFGKSTSGGGSSPCCSRSVRVVFD